MSTSKLESRRWTGSAAAIGPLTSAQRSLISAGTRDALAGAKARGVKLGNPDIAKARVTGMAVRVAAADQRAAAMRPIIEGLKAVVASTLHEIAAALNARGITTSRGSPCDAKAVSRELAGF